ncbi:SCO6880 family protein [Quadrisphaera sp. KR29]|uniref:SCO6880 family protein n=1 Tax=Quadrisphaera sp. KR29 TaxID=3461391 RepID=UPI0040440BC5
MSARDGATATAADDQVRMYGGWRLRRGIGLWGLDAASTTVVLACALVPLLLTAISPLVGAISAAPAMFVASVTAVRVGGVPLGVHVRRRVTWGRSSRAGRSSRRYGPNAASTAAAWPAPLGKLQMVEAQGAKGTYAVVRDLDLGLLTVPIRCAASSAWLVERDQADGWVGAWHAWLASLGYAPSVRWVSVVVETAPEPGTALRDEIAAREAPSSPRDARSLLKELVRRSPAAAAHVATWVCVTVDPTGTDPRRRPRRTGTAADAVQDLPELDRLISGLESSLAGCGVTVLGRADATQLLGVVADAYDPAMRGRRSTVLPATRRTASRLRTWDDGAPVAVEESWDHLRHDSGISVSWGWREAPRAQVTSDVLSRLHSPGRHPRRVALLYRPLPAADAARLLEAEVNAADFREAMRRAQRRDETARDLADREQARKAAREEASGAGVVLVSIYVTSTVTDPALLPDAVAEVEARADQSRIRLRRLYGGQAVGFATTLPLGLHPVAMTDRPRRGRRSRG